MDPSPVQTPTQNPTLIRRIHTIYCGGYYFNGGVGDFHAVALADDGYPLAAHLCSHEGFAKGDLGMGPNNTWKHDLYDAHFGPGNWMLEWVGAWDKPLAKGHVGFQEARALNRKLGEEWEAKQARELAEHAESEKLPY